jgi:PAS domain S-box-containing protein
MSSRIKALQWAILPLLLLTPSLIWLGLQYDAQQAGEERARSARLVEMHAADLQRALDRVEARLESLQVFVANQVKDGGNLDPGQFGAFAAGLHASSPWIRAFQVVSNGVITHTYPLKGNESVLGYNLLADPRPVLGRDVIRAQETGRVTITGPIELIQGGVGLMIRKALPAEAGRKSLTLVAVILRTDPLLEEAGLDARAHERVRMALRGREGKVFFGEPEVFAQTPNVCRIHLSDGEWELAGCPQAGWRKSLSGPVALFFGAGGGIVLLLCLLVYVLARSQGNLADAVRQKTDALRAELAGRMAAEEQFRLVMENLADMVAVLDLEGRRIYNSPSYVRILGDTHQLQGTSSFEQIHAEDRERVKAAFLETVRTGRGHRLEYRLVDREGRPRYIESQGSVIRDDRGAVFRVVVVSRDITERRQTESILQENETRYRFLFEHNPMPMLIYERGSLRLLAVNEAFLRHYGYSREESLALLLTDLYPEEQKEKIASLIPTLRGHAYVGEWRHRRRDGSYLTIVVSSHDLVYEGRQARVAVMTDISDRKRAEEELRQARDGLELRVAERTAELVAAKDRAEAADRLKSAFLATMSHELRTPLNSIIGFTGVILQGLAGPLTAEQRKQLDMVRESARHLLALINDVLDISKIEAGQIELVPAAFDLRGSIQSAVRAVEPLAARKQLPVLVDIAPEVGVLTNDKRRVEQVLLNLLSNAIKFTEHGEVRLSARAELGGVRVSVKDTGIGIKPEDFSRLFQPFRQLDTGLTRQHEGTGLGLVICKRLVERMGGAITVESRAGAGSTFAFTLPNLSERKT